ARRCASSASVRRSCAARLRQRSRVQPRRSGISPGSAASPPRTPPPATWIRFGRRPARSSMWPSRQRRKRLRTVSAPVPPRRRASTQPSERAAGGRGRISSPACWRAPSGSTPRSAPPPRRQPGARPRRGPAAARAAPERAERLERRRESLGQVNPLAKEEYETEKVRLTELATQRQDLEASLAELEKLRSELTETVERRFNETFDAVQKHFAEVASTLFPGGEGRLQLVDAEDEEVQPGIEVHLRP